MKEITLTRGKVAMVDDADFEELSKTKWTFSHGYAQRTRHQKREYMHRIIMNPPPSFVVDHKDGNGLNNTRSNLRNVSKGANSLNPIKLRRNKSGFRGVWRSTKGNGYTAEIAFNGSKRRKYFLDINDAVKCRQLWENEAKQLLGLI